MTVQYSKAPVVEAIIDIRVASEIEVGVLELADSFRELNSRYPHRELLESAPAFQFASSAGFSASFGAGMPSGGLRFLSQDEKKVFQARSDGFTLSVLPPYKHWEDFRDEAADLWARYVKARKVSAVTRIGLRYINRLQLPLRDQPIAQFLTLLPAVSTELGECNGFTQRLQFPQPDLEAVLLLTQSTLAPALEDGQLMPLLLDIDLFRDKMDGQAALNLLWEWLEQLRQRKNLVFEACLTDQTRDLIR